MQANGLEVVDRRAFPRKGCALNCTQDEIIRDIGVGGVRLESLASYTVDRKLDLSFSIPSIGSIRCAGQVTRIEGCPDPKKWHYGIRFVSLNGKDQKKIKHYILNRVKKDELGELRRRFLSSERHNVVEVSEPVRIQSLLKGLMESRARLTIFQEGTLEGYLEGSVKQIDNEIIRVVLDSKSRTDSISFATPFSAYFDYSYHGYFFETRLNAIPQGELHLRPPLKIYYSDKRRDRRVPVSDGTFEFPIPHPVNATYKAELLDYSESGAAFKAPMQGFYFLPDTPLKRVKLNVRGNVKEGLRGEVRYLAPLDHDHYKVGVEFSTLKRKGFEIEKVAVASRKSLKKSFAGLINKLRVGAYLMVSRRVAMKKSTVESPDLQLQIVRFKNLAGREMVGLVNSTIPLGKGRVRAPVIIIPPAYTKRKETTSALALTLIHNFKKNGQDLVVIRMDLTNATGECYIDPENRVDGKNYIHFTPESTCNDIVATIKYCENNLLFSASTMAIVSFSFTSPMARKAILQDKGQNVKYWINAMGTPQLQELIKNSGGGIDYVGNYRKGARFGVVNFLGDLVDMDNFCQNCISFGTSFLEDARQDMERLNIPVTWIYGQYDSWVSPKSIKDVMSIKSSAPREVIEVPTGHMPVSTEEAFGNFKIITGRIWHYLIGGEITPEDPNIVSVIRVREAEWNRIPKMSIGDQTSYWKSYLLGEGEKDIGYDILSLTDEYQQMMVDQINELALRDGDVVADVSAGTGNFLKILSEKKNLKELNLRIVMTDFVPEVLERAKDKHSTIMSVSSSNCEYSVLNLELSRLLPFVDFVNGELADITQMRNKVEGLNDYTLQVWKDRYSNHLHQILRGKNVDDDDLGFLERTFEEADVERILEFNHASQMARALQSENKERFESLVGSFSFEHFTVKTDEIKKLAYPLKESAFDKILLSLVVSYIFNPTAVINEMYRCLKPGGRIVFSSFRADSDMTMSYSNLIRKIEEMPTSPFSNISKEELLTAARRYANNAATLLRLGEEGTFQFFTEDQIKNILLETGFKQIAVRKSFGTLPQVLIVSGLKS